jgi:hypothetical protein
MMQQTIFEEIRSFIGSYRLCDDHETSGWTRGTAFAEADGISGDDAAELMEEFFRKFNVERGNFYLYNYFEPEGFDFFGPIRYVIQKIMGWPTRRCVPLTVGDLERAVIEGAFHDPRFPEAQDL